ncbi:MAG: WecB/TagA/CpsF family glycosyltransferase [Sphingomonas sp.]|uniref:WecB/TagA/CpsF family glycosyltransferase n=1 Tax=Sphingomonas sp. TaxID=28214 RepID=UPI001AD4F1D2|nr:WecB/TagA/CpsF family glycosyltransferase [Sphingomonas sp.]MBN8808861.1 WecB/TagA/CpsF family glycosyltransferase [Sphingomonas sp.]
MSEDTGGGPPFATVEFLGMEFARTDLDAVRRWVLAAMADERFRYVVTPNVDHVVRMHQRDAPPWQAAFVAAERDADLCVNDSRVLAKLAKLSRIDLPVVPGSDLTRILLDGGIPAGTTVALIGGGTADAAWLRERLPGARILHFDPPMRVLHSAEAQQAIVDVVEAERPHLTLFAIGAPQSEIVAHQLQRRGRARGVALCIGASIEFLTGAKRRAPRFVQRLGMEWAFRLLSEPRRLWRRYLVEGPRVFAIWRRWHRRRTAG